MFLFAFIFTYCIGNSQSQTVTLDWDGAGLGCVPASLDFACGNNMGTTAGNWNGGSKSFIDVIPAGKKVTSISVKAFITDQIGTAGLSVKALLNGTQIDLAQTPISQDCIILTTNNTFPTLTYNVSCFQGYIYGGTNTLVFDATASSGGACLDKAEITINYEDPIGFTFPSGLSPFDITLSCGADVLTPINPIAFIGNSLLPVIFTEEISSLSCFDKKIITRKWAANDGCGNLVVFKTQVITVNNDQKPLIVVPSALTVQCLADVTAAVNLPANSYCGESLIAIVTENITNDICVNKKIITRTWTAKDACGNVSTASQVINVNDTTLPTFDAACATVTNLTTNNGAVCPANAVTNLTVGQIVSTTFQPIIATLTQSSLAGCLHDNCTADADMRARVESINDDNGICPRTIIVNYRILDACDNASDGLLSRTYIITDDTKPTFVALCQSTFNFSTNAGATCPANATVSLAVNDVVNASQTWTVAGRTIPGVLGCWKDNCTSDANMKATVESIAITGDACNKTFVVGFRLLDLCGNTSTDLFVTTINVTDDTKPLFTYFPANVTVNCHEVPVPANPTGTDNCDPTPTIVYVGETRTNGNCPYNYDLVRTWSITDICGNQTVRAQSIHVVDTIKPIFVFLSDEVFNCKGTPSLLVRFANDNCSKSDKIKIEYNGEVRTNLSCPDNYTLLRKWTATDECNNSTTSTQLNTVIDKEAPTLLSLPPMTTITCSAVPSPLPPKVEDKFSMQDSIKIVLTSTNYIVGICPIKKTLRHYWEATDLCGNKNTFNTFTQVRITQPPTFVNVPANIAIGQKPFPGMFMPQAINECGDNVGVMWLGDVPVDGTCKGSKIYTRTWRAIDPCGGFSTTASQIITTGDNNPPVFTSAPLQTMYINYADLAKYPKPNLTATDDCGTPVITGPIETNNRQCNNGVAEVTWTWTATDQTGNTTTISQNLVINDAMPSVKVTAPTIIVMNVNDQYLTANVTGGAPPYKYQWLGTNNAWDVIGVAGNKINIVASRQKGEFNVIVTDSRGCKGTTLFSKEAIPWCPMMCTLADTFYTNPKDTIKGGKTSIQLMETLLDYDIDGDGNADPLKLGNGKKSFVVTSDGVKCLGKILPSTSGLISILKDSTYLKKDTVCNFGTIKLTNGKVTNPLLVQMITLGMNLRYEPKLGYAPLKTVCTNVKLDTFSKKHINDIPRKDTTKTVKALFDYANLVMSGAFPKLSDKQIDSLYKAIKGINDCFDGCKNLDLLAEDRSFSEEGLAGKIYLNQSHLRWTKRSTEFINKFEIEYSVDNQHFTLLETKINTDKRATAHAFDIIHKRPIQGVNYYRVKQYYEDGNIAYSNTVVLDFKHNPIEVSVMPNPATDVFYLTLRAFESQKSPADIYICNELGIELIYKHLDKITAEPIEFSTENLVNGIYFIRVMMDTEVIAGKKLVITKE